MRPLPITFYAYGESEEEVKDLERALYNFVSGRYDKGELVRISSLINALKRLENNPLITQFLK